MRVVLDTNTLVSSLLNQAGPSAQAFKAWRDLRDELLTSPELISELMRVTSYPRIRRKYPFTDERVNDLVNLLRQYAEVIQPTIDVSGSVPADPQDETVIACAAAGSADIIVSGDRHLLDLETYQDIPIVTVVQFLARLAADDEDARDF